MFTHTRDHDRILLHLNSHARPTLTDPAKERRGNSLYIVVLAVASFPMMWIYHYKDDIVWGFLLKYAFDLYVCIRIRLPHPLDPGNHEQEGKRGKEGQKYWDQFWVPYNY